MKCVWLWAALGAASGAGCGDPFPLQGIQLNLDRPVDVSFACYGPGPGDSPTAQPTAVCQAWSPPLHGDPLPGPADSTTKPSWYAFILQSTSGTVVVATSMARPAEDMGGGFSDGGGDFHVLDADPLNPGKNAISVGEDPIAIATDKAGCFEVTANAGSCDLSELEINSALDDIPLVQGKVTTPVRVERVAVTNAAGGMILARPAAMVAEPGTTAAGNACPATATGRVYIAYPSCHLVAGVDTATGKIVAGIAYAADGTPSILSGAALDNVTCPAECTNPGGGASGPITPGVRPVALDLRFDPRVDAVNPGSKPAPTSRLVIGADNSASLTVVELDPDPSKSSDPLSLFQVALEDSAGKLGVTAVALSPQIGMGGAVSPNTGGEVSDDTPMEQQGQYAYAVATDGTVRVADVLNLRRECDTQIDGRFLRGASATELPCVAAGDPIMRPRRAGARGPGIELPGGVVPTSVAIVKGRTTPPPALNAMGAPTGAVQQPAPTIWLGYFAIVTASSGAAYVVNVDDDYAPDRFSSTDKLDTAPVLVMAHQLRDSFSSRGAEAEDSAGNPRCDTSDPPLQGLAGGPRVSAAPAQAVPTGSLAAEFLPELPSLRQVSCTQKMDQNGTSVSQTLAVSELAFGASEDVRDKVYPDLRSVASETWTLTWEGTLSLDNVTTSVDGPIIRTGQIFVDGQGMRITDPAQPFCDMGVEPFDTVDLRGCNPANGDSDCPSGYTCYVHPESVGVGIGACMLASEAPRLADACFPFLTTLRRYTVGQRVDSGDLVLLERKHELAMAPIDGCVDDAQCDQLAQDAAKINANADPFTSRTHWTCQTDPLRAPIHPDPARNKRCVQACSTDPAHPWDCATGAICRPLAANSTEGVCMEGVEPPQACVNGPQRYDVRASEAFTVIGSQSGYVHSITRNADGTCTRPPDPTTGAVQIGRVPLSPLKVLACADPTTVNPITGELLGQPGVFEPNPCSLTEMQFDSRQQSAMSACAAAPPPLPSPPPLQMRSAQAIRFRNSAMTLTLVDPYQPCLPNNQGALANVSLVPRGYQLEFEQKGGFTPFALPAIGPAAYPVKVVRGPTDSIWVVDDGDVLAGGIGQVPTRGRVFRIEAVDIAIVNTIQ